MRGTVLLLLAFALAAAVTWTLRKDPRDDALRMTQDFTLCGAGGSAACVIDGDTLAIGRRRIRLTGFDAPEMDGACEGERMAARAARAALRDWIARGPFLLTGGDDPPYDRYGRELRAAFRAGGGEEEWLSEWMIDRRLAADDAWGRGDIDWCAQR